MRALSLGSMNDPDGFGVGHIPLSRAAFGSWLPAKIRYDPVTDDELIWVTECERSGGSVGAERTLNARKVWRSQWVAATREGVEVTQNPVYRAFRYALLIIHYEAPRRFA